MSEKIFKQYTKENNTFVIDQLFNKEEVKKLSDIVYRVIGKSSVEQIKSNIFQNMSLMMLHVKVIPDAIQNEIYLNVEKELKTFDSLNFSNLTNKDKILEGTDWLKVTMPKQYDPFSNLPETKSKTNLKLIGKKTNKKLF